MDLDGAACGVVRMTGSVSPLEMPRLPDGAEVSKQRSIARPMTLATVPQPRSSSMVFDLSSMDETGRVFAHAFSASQT